MRARLKKKAGGSRGGAAPPAGGVGGGRSPPPFASTPESFVHVLATERLPQTPWQSSGNPLLHLPAGRPVASPPQPSPGSASADSLAAGEYVPGGPVDPA